ncbi:MAG: DUF378 domain-containing protein [Patescibacteria group bacterium UBA2103]
MNALDWIAYILVFVGGINWGLVGIAQLDLVQAIFGAGNIANIIYILVGISALYMLFNMFMKK